MSISIILIILLALLFDFFNGMNDAANSIATIVSTRVLTPLKAILWAAFFNFVAAFFFGVHVANTIGKGIIDPRIVTTELIAITLISAITWTYFCTRIGLPISVSHALVGGLMGTAIAQSGLNSINLAGIIKIGAFIIISPLLGMIFGYIIMIIVYKIFYRYQLKSVNRWFRRLQLVSAALYSLGHGTNDAQKTMGIIAILLFSNGYLGSTFHIPFWIVLSCHFAIAMGTLLGGWKVVETLGMKMTKLHPADGFSAETAAASSIIFSSVMGVPVSTTHTITGSIIGVAATTRFSMIRWGMAYKILWAWVLTIPCTAAFSILSWYVFMLFRDHTFFN